MGTLKRMGLGFKAGLGRQLSRADIYSYYEGDKKCAAMRQMPL
jgi:hypothetical protein